MGKLEGGIQYTGAVGQLTAYRKKGSDKIIVRAKTGTSKKRIKKSSRFTNTRKLNSEFSGAGKAAGFIRRAMVQIVHLNDKNISGKLTKICKKIQVLDTVGLYGQRSVEISKFKQLLVGFNVNQQTSFDSLLRHPVEYTLSREERMATISFPQIWPDMNFFAQKNARLFRFIATLGVVPDLKYKNKDYLPVTGNMIHGSQVRKTDWLPITSGFQPMDLSIALSPLTQVDETQTIILALGIEFGVGLTDSLVEPVKNAGCAKVLAVV